LLLVGGSGSQKGGFDLEIGLGGYFDHAVTKRNLLKDGLKNPFARALPGH